MDYEYITEEHTEPEPPRLAHLTSQQRVVIYAVSGIANDLQRSSDKAEQHTAALLMLMADAVERQYEAELVALVRAWRMRIEQGDGG